MGWVFDRSRRALCAHGLALIGSLVMSGAASAGDQVLACSPGKGEGSDAQVMISEGLLSRGRILWPSQTGTVIYKIEEKSPVSYLAAEDAKSPRTPSRLYINRLNGELQLELPVRSDQIGVLSEMCQGRISRDECARRLDGSEATSQPACFASIDCAQLAGPSPLVVQASYKCRRSFKKF